MDFVVEDFAAATFTPFHENGDLNLGAIDHYQDYLHKKDVKHVYVNGSTGEGTSLTTQERKDIAKKWVELSRLPGREMKVLVQVGGTTYRDAIELTEHAASIGADAISALAPLYFTPNNVDELVDYCKRLAEKAPKLPFYYYHIPDRTGVRLNMEEFLVKSRGVIPSLRGIKFSSKDLFEGTKCLRTLDANGRPYDLLFGSDEQVLAAFAMGFKGAIGSTYSMIPGVYHRMRVALEGRDLDEARKMQYHSVDLIKVMFEFANVTGGLLPAMKAVMVEQGIDLGHTRYPLQKLDAKTKANLIEKVKAIGYFDW